MKCQYCNCTESKVIDSRPTEESSSIRRRRECMNCGRRFTTYEKIELLPLMVVKRDGRREPFDAQKIKAGIMRELKAVNDVAYVRFAAVYRLFTDIGDFMQELQKLVEENKQKAD